MSRKIEVLAASTQTDVLDHQCDIVEDRDTIKEARQRAKYYVSGEYEKYLGDDAGEPMRYARVMVDGQCHDEYFAKGYNGQKVDDETGLITVR